MVGRPEFQRFSDGRLMLKKSEKAKKCYEKPNKNARSKPREEVHKEALRAVQLKKGDAKDEIEVLSEYKMQFGSYFGQTFKWLLENDLGYAVYLVDEVVKESSSQHGKDGPNDKSNLSNNKEALKKYAFSFREVRDLCDLRREKREREARNKERADRKATASSTPNKPAVSSLAAGLASGRITSHRFMAQLKSRNTSVTVKPNLPRPSTTPAVTATCTRVLPEEDDDEQLCLLAEQVEKDIATKTTPSEDQHRLQAVVDKGTQTYKLPQIPDEQPSTSTATAMAHPAKRDEYPLYEGWRQSLPKADQIWVSQALFKRKARNGKPELDYSRINKLWWNPPQPPLITNQPPSPDCYFAQRLLLWMPRKLWKVRLCCPHDGCDDQQLTSAGAYLKVRQVTDVDGYYNLAAEYMECKNCMRKVISWSPAIISQLDHGHQVQFPVLLTYQYACDVRVIRLLRQRTLGNSSTLLQKQLSEQHSEKWMQQTMQYLTECKYYSDACKRGLITAPTFEDPPKFIPPPKAAWLLTVYGLDIMKRVDHIKASITSTFGRILKMDSTKKIVKKLAGRSAGTAAWCTNIGNETGQVLMSVLTASEGVGLGPLTAGLMRRYANANIPPPEVLYVDRDCCGGTFAKTKEMFSLWDKLVVRLDVWHFMRRITAACTTESHQLYAYFCSRLSYCIFQWSQEDLDALRSAKRSELEKEGIRNLSDEQVIGRITKRELALHCRRQTRGAEKTTQLIHNLLETFSGDQGQDTMGVPLLDSDRVWEIWESQKHHIECLQDPEGIQLYIRTTTMTRGGVPLPTYRCARGSTSLESFHLHINRFIPGQCASDMHFQAYLLEGLSRWNADRAANAVEKEYRVRHLPETYSGLLSQAVNNLGQEVMGQNLCAGSQQGIYTGEQIGVEYLYSQTGQVLQGNYLENEEDSQGQQQEPLSDVDPNQLDEGFEDAEDGTVPLAADVYSTSVNDKGSEDNSDEDSEESLQEESVGPDNIQGYAKVDALAEYLVSLREGGLALTHSQAAEIINLWNNLDNYDKQPTKFAPRHRTKLVKGKFKATKKRDTIVIPGVDSVKRCFLGANSGPAQWPDCNRYIEATMIKLCNIHPARGKSKGSMKPRWNLICESYKTIRDRILNNAKVMRETNIQMVEINHTTLTQWFNKRQKRQEQEVLKQGIKLLPAPATTTKSLPPPEVLPQNVPQVTFPFPFTFQLPPNTTGMAKGRRLAAAPKIQTETAQPAPIMPKPELQLAHQQPQQHLEPLPGPSGIQMADLPKSTYYYQKRKLESGETTEKKRCRRQTYNCSRCGQVRDPKTHKAYYGKWYCPTTETQTYEQWLAEQKRNRESKKQM